ncbi:hypothetical protein [Vibrio tritonius]|nr:hypothetical protein [Vibrio tritonius]
MQNSDLPQRAQVKLNDGKNGHSLSTSLGIRHTELNHECIIIRDISA